MTAQFIARAPRTADDVSKGDGIWIVGGFGPHQKRRQARVFDVLRRAAVLEEIEGRPGERQTLPFNELEMMNPAEMPPSAPAHRAWLKQKERERKNAEENAQRVERANERRQPPTPVMPTVVRRPSSEPLRVVPPALQNIQDTVKVQPPAPSGPPSMLTWAEQGLQMNIQQAHLLEDRIGDIDQEIEKLKSTIADQIASLELKKKGEQEKLAQTRLMIETIEAQLAQLKAS